MRKEIPDIICCPFCKSDLKKKEEGYLCAIHGDFGVDKTGRLLFVKKEILEKNMDQHNSGVNWLKSFFKKYPKIYYAIWHVFCPVMMLANGPRMILKHVKENGVLVDIGSGPERINKKFINVDIFPFPEVDIVADAATLPLQDGSADGVVSESVLEHVDDLSRVASEITRIVKPGGYIYVSIPFITPYHASPDDFSRLTMSGLERLFSDFDVVKSGTRAGPWSAFLVLLAYWLGVVFSFGSKKFSPFLAHIFMLVLGPIKYLDYFFIKIPGSEAVAAHLYILGKKR